MDKLRAIQLSRMAVAKNRFIRLCIFILGVLSVLLGFVGAILPVIPTTPFVLLAAWCFLKSSAKAHAWIYRQPLFGKALKDWEEDRSIVRQTKVLAISAIMLSIVFIWVKVTDLWVKFLVTALLLFVTAFISVQKER